jgi:hypothetical protein
VRAGAVAFITQRHRGLAHFDNWPATSLRVLRAADEHPRTAREIAGISTEMGEPMKQPGAAAGINWLAKVTCPRPPRPQLLVRNDSKLPYLCHLTEIGLTLRAMSLEHFPPQAPLDREGHGEGAGTPIPDPVTPLWVVHGEGTDYLVIAANAQKAIALVEREHEGEMASRAVGLDTTAELILQWGPR